MKQEPFPKVLECINDLSKDQVLTLLKRAKSFKHEPDQLPIYNNQGQVPIMATSFLENSTRTKHSFSIALQKLGGMYIDFDAESSSLKKGETLEETLLTLKCQGVDLCIIRQSISHELEAFKKDPPVRIINGGDGTNQHPTQALLDLFTILELGIAIEGKTMAIIGDCLHSRVGHSLCDLLPMFGAKIILCGPKECLPESSDNPAISISTSFEETIAKSDILYTLRIQKERHDGVPSYYENYHQDYGLSVERMNSFDKQFPVLHPGPVNIGVELSSDLMKAPIQEKHFGYLGHQQVIHSIPMRMAIIEAMLQEN
jgi:aspartate carbamoyltransferase catalytic subunit